MVFEIRDLEGFFFEEVLELVQLLLENSFQVQKRLIFPLSVGGILLVDPRLVKLFRQLHSHIVHLCLQLLVLLSQLKIFIQVLVRLGFPVLVIVVLPLVRSDRTAADRLCVRVQVCDVVRQDFVQRKVFLFMELRAEVCVVDAHETCVLGVFGVWHGLFGALDGLV